MKIRYLLVLLLLFGPLPHAAAVDLESDLQAMLDRRSKSIREGDRTTFMDTVLDADKGFVEAQRQLFERMEALAIEGYRLVLTLDDVPEFTRKKDRELFKGEVMVIGVEERFRFKGLDVDERINDIIYTFVKSDGRWRIASDTAAEDLGLYSSRNLWELGPVAVRESQHFALIHHPQEAELAEGFLATAEQALGQANKVWLRPWHQKVPIIVPSDKQELERFLGASFDVSNFVAFAGCSLEREDDDRWDELAPVMILNKENMLRHSPESKLQIFAHELVHVATCDADGPYVPLFVQEGMAQLTDAGATSILNSAVRRKSFDRRLPEDWEFYSDVGSRIGNAYDESTSSFRFMRERFGIEKVNVFYETMGKARLEPGTSAYHLRRSMREALGIELEQFEAEWAEYAAKRQG